MTIEPKVHEGDEGTVLYFDTKEVITGATDLALYVMKPDKSLATWTPSIDGTMKLKYTTGPGDIPDGLSGVYLIQPKLTISGWSGRGTTVKLTVYPKFD